MSERIVTVDVRDDLRRGQEPFSKIMGTVAQLKPGEALLLIAPFEPKPLYEVLASQGFSHQSKPTESGDWEVLFKRGPVAASASAPARPPRPPRPSAQASPAAGPKPMEVVDVDTRGLEPPQPLVVILEALEKLPPGAELRARTDRKPMHLYTQLLERGFTGQSEEQPDGSFITHIRRR